MSADVSTDYNEYLPDSLFIFELCQRKISEIRVTGAMLFSLQEMLKANTELCLVPIRGTFLHRDT